MNKKLQVFVSSTYTDLVEERQAAAQAILEDGHIPVGMELFKNGKPPMQIVHKCIDKSDAYLLILGGRYGSIEKTSGLSYIELEYRYALSKNMPVFAIVLDYNYLFLKAASYGENTIFEKEHKFRYNSFKNKLESNIVKVATDLNQITSAIHFLLNDVLNSPINNLIGGDKSMRMPNKNKISIFVVMPYSEAWSDDTYDLIKEVCNNLDVNLNRADEILGSQSIYNDIITNIIESDIIIADITVKNANVFYELGYAHALKKNVILIRQPHDDMVFDISQFRYIEYELSYKKAKEFQKRLTDTISIYKK